MSGVRSEQAAALERALGGAAEFERFLRHRGYERAPEMVGPDRASLAGARPMAPADPAHEQAPRLLTLWRDDVTRRALHGVQLRRLQKDAVHFRERVLVYDPVHAPDLFVLGCPEFLMVFPLDGDPFARRQRFTVEQVRHSALLAGRLAQLSAASMVNWARAVEGDAADSWDDLLAHRRAFDFDKHLYGGGRLDDEFVAFMGQERRRLLEAVLDPGREREMLQPVIDALGPELTGLEEPATSADLVRDASLRKHVIAVVDTVLLRLVLYRYLEAQFPEVDPEEQRGIGFGTWDELVDETADVSHERHDALVRQALAMRKQDSVAHAEQLDLFAVPPPSVEVHTPEAFVEGVRVRAAHYQQSAGGDLHRGNLARAADVLQDALLADPVLRNAFATLIEGTRSTRYSFHYEDLDPRAFQRFYEDTIGTDVGVDLQDGRVRVVPRWRNRKEQGAYFTDETVCRWLVERTLGRWFDQEWLPGLTALLEGGRIDVPALGPIKAHLERLAGLRIIDPTCGGGIFLRAAFEYLSRRREEIATLLELGLTPAALDALASEEPVSHLLPSADPGAWEWHVLLHVLYGVDLDVKAINVASNLLTLSALTYRPKGLCFPSFINTNLKHGNALVTPLAEDERVAFAEEHRERLARAIRLRRRLRSLDLTHEAWADLHQECAGVLGPLVHGLAHRAWTNAFGRVDARTFDARLRAVGFFVYEAEFPEVFYDADGALRPDAGFDFVVGNPPWEEPAAELKHFLPEIDPDYRELKGSASKIREDELLSRPEVARRWRVFQQSVEDYKALLTRSGYRFQRRAVRGRIPGAHTNLFKYATEMAWRLLREGGAAGLILDGGLWNDLAANGLRAMLLDESRLEAVCGFTNNKGLFPDIDGRMKFGCVVWRRGGRTDTFRALFMRTSWEDLDRFDEEAAVIDADVIRNDPRDTYPVPEVRSAEHWRAERALARHPVLGEAPWDIDIYSRELNAGEQRHYFNTAPAEGRIPVLQGAQFNHWGVHDGEAPQFWVDTGDEGAGGFLRAKQEGRVLNAIAEHLGVTKNKERAARDWLRVRTGRAELPPEWLRLDWEGYRLAWRDITNATNQRTLIAGIVPPRVALTHKAPFIRPFAITVDGDGVHYRRQFEPLVLLYLAGMLSSYICDSIVRSRLMKTNLTAEFLRGLPVPAWRDTPTHRRIAELTARLTCRPAPPDRPWADYTALAAELGLTPEHDGLVDPLARREAEVELNALACGLYGLDHDAFRFLMTTLFDTPRHRDTHFEYRDAIIRHGWLPEGERN